MGAAGSAVESSDRVVGGAPGGRSFAGFGARLGAAIIDWLLLVPITVVAWIVLAAGPKTDRACSFNAVRTCRGPSGAAWGMASSSGLRASSGRFSTSAWMDGRTGQTLGKRVVSIRVVDAYNRQRRSGVGRAIGRYFGRIISSFAGYLGFLWMLWDPNKQTWHDKMVNERTS